MAFLEDPNCCSICDNPCGNGILPGGIPMYFCRKCFHEWEQDIISGADWVLGMLRIEKARRKRRNRQLHAGGFPQPVTLEGRGIV